MTLSEGQRIALENLARKRAGQDVDWISIADARALTDLGLAERTRAGWVITEAGLAVVKPAVDDRDDEANDRPTPLRP